MSAILSQLSDLSNKVNISSLKDKLKDIYQDAQDKVSIVKEALEKKAEEKPKEVKPNDKMEGYGVPAAEKTTKDKIIDFFVLLKDYFVTFAKFLLGIIFYIALASLVANDMIMYAPTIRGFFFVFTLLVTYSSSLYAGLLTIYYLLRRGYDYYHENLSSDPVKPPKSFPMIFSILPLTTYYPTTPLLRFFLWPFMYQKSDNEERMAKENKRLDAIMRNYWTGLNESFDYLDKIKTNEPFSRLYEINKEHLTKEYMHPIKKNDLGGEIITSYNELKKKNPDVENKFHKMQAAPNKPQENTETKPTFYTMRPANQAEKLPNVQKNDKVEAPLPPVIESSTPNVAAPNIAPSAQPSSNIAPSAPPASNVVPVPNVVPAPNAAPVPNVIAPTPNAAPVPNAAPKPPTI